LSLLTSEQVIDLETACKHLTSSDGIRFCGVINNKGRLVAGGFKPGIIPHENDKQRQMLYMELALDLSMRKEFDNSFGRIKSVTTRREEVNLICIPFNQDLIVISTEPTKEEDEVTLLANQVFRLLVI
jgi:Family of unknown function (DUF6659)